MKIAKIRDVKTPTRGTTRSAGLDFYVPNDFGNIVLLPHQDILIPSGIRADIPEGYMLMAAEKSGVVTSKHACVLAGRKPKPEAFTTVLILGAKIVDEDYQGEIHIHLINIGHEPAIIKAGMKIAQFILIPVLYENVTEVPESDLFLEVSERGEGGFGSTGNK